MALPSVSITHHGGRSTHTKHTLDSHRRTHTELSVLAATVSMFPPTSFLPTPLPRSPSSLLHLHSHLALFIFHTGAGVTFGVSHFNHSLLLSSLSSHLSKLIDPENTFCKEVLQSLTELFPSTSQHSRSCLYLSLSALPLILIPIPTEIPRLLYSHCKRSYIAVVQMPSQLSQKHLTHQLLCCRVKI